MTSHVVQKLGARSVKKLVPGKKSKITKLSIDIAIASEMHSEEFDDHSHHVKYDR